MPETTRPHAPETVAADGDDLVITTNASSVEAGSYIGELVDLDTFTFDADDGERTLLRWTFSLPDLDDMLVDGVSSLATSPRSKAFAWLAALAGADAVAKPKATFRRSELLGKRAMIVVEQDDKGFSKVANLAPLPKPRAA